MPTIESSVMILLQLTLNLLLLLFWTRIWVRPENAFYFNPFLSGPARYVDQILAFLYPVLRMPEQFAALILLIFFSIFKTLVCTRLGEPWMLSFGSIFAFTPPVTKEIFWESQFVYSTLKFALFLVRLWTLYFFVQLITPAQRISRAGDAFKFFTRPFSFLPLWLQPFVLFTLHLVLAYLTVKSGPILHALAPLTLQPQPLQVTLFLNGEPLHVMLKIGALAALSFADSLALMNTVLILCILGNFIAAFLQLKLPTLICHESVEVILGRFSKSGTVTSGFDFTPMFFFFAVNIVYSLCSQLFYKIITSAHLQ